MKLRSQILITGFIDSFNAIRKKPLYFIAQLLIDLFFLFVFFIIYYFFFENIINRIISLLMLTGETLQGLTQTDIALNFLSNQQQMNSLIINIGFWIFGLAVLTYLLYCIFQGASWFIAHKMFKIKTKPADYIKRFFAVNFVWYLMVVIIIYFYVKAVIYTQVLRNQSNLGVISTFSVILLMVICYFAFISYVLIKKHGFIDSIKGSFSLGIKEFLTIASMYILFILGFALIDVLLRLLFMISTTLMVIVGIILIFPFIAYARLVIISVIGNLIKTKNN
ncbi:MAG: hypothetical protein KKA61_04625 [Nanoarchaeota archaeon]|nr:hypothetical protein [Nanoarchaeota archaeon]